eukprot:5940442-Amphidinium_carterae.1
MPGSGAAKLRIFSAQRLRRKCTLHTQIPFSVYAVVAVLAHRMGIVGASKFLQVCCSNESIWSMLVTQKLPDTFLELPLVHEGRCKLHVSCIIQYVINATVEALMWCQKFGGGDMVGQVPSQVA